MSRRKNWMTKSYSEMRKLKTFEERFNYLNLHGKVSDITFGGARWINQQLYRSKRWRTSRNEAIIRDEGCDLGDPDRAIHDKILVHHINPLTMEDIEEDRDCIYDLENLICTTHNTHNAIHYSDEDHLIKLNPERTPGDTCPWK